MKINFCILLCSLCFVVSGNIAYAQFNDTIHHFINLSATGNFNRTSDGVTYLFNNSAKYSLRKKSIVLNANAAYLYGQTPENLTNNDVKTTLDFNLYKTLPHFYYWGLVNFTSSYSLKINSQLQSGLGAAYRIIDEKQTMLSVSDGFLFESSNLQPEEDSSYQYQTVRNSLRIQFRTTYKDFISFNSTFFYQPSLAAFSDYLITANASLEFKLLKWMRLVTTFNYNKISRTERENFIFTYGLVIERYF